MLTEAHAVLPASDLGRARSYYHDKFGFDPAEEHEGILMYRPADATKFDIYETPNAGTAKNTQMCFSTDDLDAEMARLRDLGVVFEDYDVPGLKTENGVAEMDGERTAWFRDSEGNFICISQSR
jgi:catechol 2,3-dioxygenase-like lactoylglutathione lyase family enzyme